MNDPITFSGVTFWVLALVAGAFVSISMKYLIRHHPLTVLAQQLFIELEYEYMSHIATVDLEIKDLSALAEAARRLGLEFVQNQRTYRWFGTHVGDYPLPPGFKKEELGHCLHALRIPLDQPGADVAYEIGVVARRDGKPGYAILWDFYGCGFGLQDKVGKDCNALKQSYAVVVAERAAAKQGFRVTHQAQADGSVVLRLKK